MASAHTAIDVAPGQARRRWIIQLLGDERTLKNVLEHHEEREEKGMLPELGLAATWGTRRGRRVTPVLRVCSGRAPAGSRTL